ncbi:Tc toxin subunit A-related protein [Enterobacter asburiae]
MISITKEYANFPFDDATGNALKALDFTSVHDILAVDEERFRCDYDSALNNCAAAIYSQAKTFAPLANKYALATSGNMDSAGSSSAVNTLTTFSAYNDEGNDNSRIARYQNSVWQTLFGRDITRYAEPGSIQSLDSPVSYLLYLANRLKSIKDGGSTALNRLFKRRPDLQTMLLSNAAMNQIIPASELAGEILTDATKPLCSARDDADFYLKLATASYPLTLPFNAAAERTRLGLEAVSLPQGELYEKLARNYRFDTAKHKAALAWSGIDPELAVLLTETLPANVTPVVLSYKINGQESTTDEGGLLDVSSVFDGMSAPAPFPVKVGDVTVTLTGVLNKDNKTLSFAAALDKSLGEKDVSFATTTLTLSASCSVEALVVLHGAKAAQADIDKVVAGTASDSLAKYFGTDIAGYTAVRMKIPAEMLSQAAGVTTQRLAELLSGGDGQVKSSLTGFDLNGRSSGARYLWGSPVGVHDEAPGETEQGQLPVTPYLLLRLHKFVRLLNHVDISAAELDMVLSSAIQAEKGAKDITQGSLRALGVYLRYRDKYKMTAAEFASMLTDIPVAAHAGQRSLWETLFATGKPVLDGKSTVTAQKALIAAAGNMSPADIDAQLTAWEAKTSQKWADTATITNISALLRPALLAKRLSMSVSVLLKLINVITGKDNDARLAMPSVLTTGVVADTLDLLLLLDEVLQWMAENKWSAEEVVVQSGKRLTEAQKNALAGLSEKSVNDAAPILAEQFSLQPEMATILALFCASQKTWPEEDLQLIVDIIARYNLNGQAILPWVQGIKVLTDQADLTFWPQLVLMSDYAWLAANDDPATPAVISTLYKDQWQTRLAAVYQVDPDAAKALLTSPTYQSAQHALLARRVAMAKQSGWSLADINNIVDNAPDLANRTALSLRVGPQDDAGRQTVSDRFGERRNLAVLGWYQALCRQHFITAEGRTGERAFNEHAPDTTTVAGQLLSDAQMTASVTTSRVSEAIAALQMFIQRIAEGLENGLQLNAGELQRWRETDSRYAVWAADVQLHWHPDQYIIPAGRLNKTPAFQVFENRLSQSRLDDAQIERALNGYLGEFEQAVSLDVIGGYQEGMDASTSTYYFLARSKKAPFDYWFRRWGNNEAGIRIWTAWEKITLPMQQNILLSPVKAPKGWDEAWRVVNTKDQALPVQARLVALNGRLYFIWVSVKAAMPDSVTSPIGIESGVAPDASQAVQATEHNLPPKNYYHAISVVHHQLDGGWSEPVELYQSWGLPEGTIDPAPHLNAFVIPEQSAKPLAACGVEVPETGDLLMVSLLSLPSGKTLDPENNDELTTRLLFDAFLNEVSPHRQKQRKDGIAREWSKIDITKLQSADEGAQTYIRMLDNASYLWHRTGTGDAVSGNEPYFSTHVMSACIPGSWLFTERHMLHRGQAVFGNIVPLTLTVENAGQSGVANYAVHSVVSLKAEQFNAIPSGYKLVHFLTWQGRSNYSQIQSAGDNKVTVYGSYNDQQTSQGSLIHGVVLVKAGSSSVVAYEGAKDALAESGKLSVARREVQQNAPEIRENKRGVQFLVTNHPTILDTGGTGTIHAIEDPWIGQTTTSLPGVSFKLANTPVDVNMLKDPVNWSAGACFLQGAERYATWTWDLPATETLSLITQIQAPKAGVKTATFAGGSSFWQGDRNVGQADIMEDKPLYIVQPVAEAKGKTVDSTFEVGLLQPNDDGNTFSTMYFRFEVFTLDTTASAKTLQKLKLSIVPEKAFSENMLTATDWGWLQPQFYQNKELLTLTRRYQLLSREPQYLLVKIATTDLDANKVSLGLQQPVPQAASVFALKKDGKPELLASNQQDSYQYDKGTVSFTKDVVAHLKAQYVFVFIAMKWSPGNDIKELLFTYGDIKNASISIDTPPLSKVDITANCTPDRLVVGQDAVIRVRVEPHGETFTNGTLSIRINPVYQLFDSGLFTPPGTVTKKEEGTLTLPLTGSSDSLSFTLPVQLLTFSDAALPLATITLTSGSSSVQKVLPQPSVSDVPGIPARFQWWYGKDGSKLTKVEASVPLTKDQLSSPILIAAITPPMQEGIASLVLPDGIDLVEPPVSVKAADGERFVLKTEDLNSISFTAPGTLLIPLKLKDTNTKFIGQLQASLKQPPYPGAVWTQTTVPFVEPTKAGTLQVSSVWQVESVPVRFGDPLSLQLTAVATAPSKDINVKLQIKKGYSLQENSNVVVVYGSTMYTIPFKKAAQKDAEGYWPATNTLILSDSLKEITLTKDLSMTLNVPVFAQPADVADTGDNFTRFTVNSKGAVEAFASEALPPNPMEDELMPDLVLPSALLRGCGVSVCFYDTSGQVIRGGSLLEKGKTYQCHISLLMGEEDINRQLDTTQGVGDKADAALQMVITPDAEIFDVLSAANPVKLSGATLLGSGTKYPNGGASLVLGFGKDQTLNGVVIVPLTVKAKGSSPAAIRIAINLLAANVTKAKYGWKTGLVTTLATSVGAAAIDPADAPYQNLHFSHDGDNTFSDPINLPSPVLLGDGKNTSTGLPRLVRLNSLFGAELVRTARRDVRILFKPGTQDYPLPPMAKDSSPDAVENDVANLMYFWELFFHVPMLVSRRLNEEGRYQEAQDWLNHLFEPFAPLDNGLRPSPWKCRLLTASFSYVSADTLTGVTDPDLIASLQPVYYQRAVFFAYVKNILDEGDSQFRTLSRDGFNRAHQCYLLAARLLGEDDSGNLPVSWAPLQTDKAIPEYIRAQRQDAEARFFIPRSNLHDRLLKQLRLRLFNLRNGLTLDGNPLSLPLFDVPVDPVLLLRNRGLQRDNAKQLSPQTTLFRYGVLYPRASAAVDVLIQFGSQLLSATERQEDLGYQTLLCNQQKLMGRFVLDSQKDSLNLSQTARNGLQAAYDSAKARQDKLQAWIDTNISSAENTSLDLRSRIRDLQISGSSMLTVGAALDVIPNIFGLADGGARPAAIPNAVGMALNTTAESNMSDATTAEIRESYARRLEEWQMQKLSVDAEVAQLDAQLKADTLQTQIYQRQLDQTAAQLQQFDDQLQFMQNRFTRKALYQWLSGQISALYYQVYDIASSLCMMAQAAWQYETGAYDKEPDFFSTAGWLSSQRGMTSGEQLRLGLMKMDKEYLSRHVRSLELRHTFSVKTSAKTAWEGFRNAAADKGTHTQTLEFFVSELDLARRYPGLIQRQVVAVTVTLPCVVGPMEDISAILVQNTGYFVKTKDKEAVTGMLDATGDANIPKGKVQSMNGRISQIALSSGLDDAGVFVLNFNDEMLLPFEGNGVVGRWTLHFPMADREEQKRIIKSLTDVIITFHYRARDPGWSVDEEKAIASLVTQKLKEGGQS